MDLGKDYGGRERKMIELSEYEAKVYHHLLWNYLAHEGVEDKSDSLFWEEHKWDRSWVESDCFFCEYFEDCPECLFNTEGSDYDIFFCVNNEDSPYLKWIDAKTEKERKKWAKRVRDLV